MKTYSKKQARKLAFDAVRRKEIIKPGKCEYCGEPEEFGDDGRTLLHAHHADYTKPLDLTWLCNYCHAEVHADDQ